MKTIWKFELKVVDIQNIEMPKNAQILSVKMQNEIPVLYALVNTDNESEERLIEIFGTGHEVMHDTSVSQYIGTFKMRNDKLMFHVFEHIKI